MEIQEVKKIILEIMKNENKPLTSGQITEKTNIDKKLIEKAMNNLKKDNLIISPKRCYWEPKNK